MKTAVFTGSFDPFTVGHDDIVRRALPLFDRIIIGVGCNEHKQCMQPTEQRCETIRGYYNDEPRVEVMPYSDLTVDFCARVGARYIIKGVRSMKDFEYERDMAEVNRRLSGVETVCLFATPELAHISSSVVRELLHYGKDVSDLLPMKPQKMEENL